MFDCSPALFKRREFVKVLDALVYEGYDDDEEVVMEVAETMEKFLRRQNGVEDEARDVVQK